MTRTYYIRYDTLNGVKYDKITHRSAEEREHFHKVEALDAWKKTHIGYSKLNINAVLTIKEYNEIRRNK